MQKYIAFVNHADPATLPPGFHDIYVASDVDARIAELENIVGLAREYVDAELTDDPTIADEGTALYALAQALAAS